MLTLSAVRIIAAIVAFFTALSATISGGSLMLAPEICVPALKAMKQQFGDKIYGRYGFTDAFHPTNGWASADVLGLDTGITLLSAENLRSGNLWKWFMRNPEIPKAMKLAGMSL